MKRLPRGLAILYEDRDILVVDKPAGLLTVATNTEKSRTAHFILTDYVRRGSPRSRYRILVVHRLDRETSGVLVFAKSEDVKYFLQARWPDTEKKYLAVVHGTPAEPVGTISTYLAENSAHVVYSTDNAAKGKLSHTAYKVLRQAGRFSLLEVTLLTGRKHQIRVHLADQGHPVVGDRLYGRQSDDYQRMALHARSISFTHPSTGERLTFEAEIPPHFDRLVRRTDRRRLP